MSDLRQESLWERDYLLRENDITIIGAGIVGFTAAFQLAQSFPGKRILVIDRSPVPYGATTRNAGFACFGSLSELLEAEEELGDRHAVFDLIERRFHGLKQLLNNFNSNELNYERTGNFELFSEKDQPLFEKCLEILGDYNQFIQTRLNITHNYLLADDLISTFGFDKVTHIIKSKGEGLLNPGMLFRALYKKATGLGVIFLGGIEVVSVTSNNTGHTLYCPSIGELQSRYVLWTTNGFASQVLGEHIVPARAQILATHPLPQGVPFKGGFHIEQGYYYFRSYNDRIILGGGRNLDIEGETTITMGTSAIIQNKLELLLNELIAPGLHIPIDQRWSGIMAVGPRKHAPPIVQRLSSGEFVAVRMGTMGIALGSLIGAQAAESIIQAASRGL
jgi:gamma-glutamylputrescine oxidase